MYATDVCRPALAEPFGKVALLMAMLAFLLAPLASHPLLAQGLEQQEAIDAIVGSEVKTEETTKEEQVGRVVAAIENAPNSAEMVRKTFNLDTLEIIYLPDLDNEDGAIEQAMAENEEAIKALHDSIEGSAMFYHAVDSRAILLRDVVAVEFGEGDTVTIFVNGAEQ